MLTIKIKIDGVPKDYYEQSFGRQMGHLRAIEDFKSSPLTVTCHIVQKRLPSTAAWREFVKLHKPTQYFAKYHDTDNYRDDSYQVWYRTSE